MPENNVNEDCATFLRDIAEELPVEEFAAYAADAGPYLSPEALSQLQAVEQMLAEARQGLRGIGERLAMRRLQNR
jgi:hypothetical protein